MKPSSRRLVVASAILTTALSGTLATVSGSAAANGDEDPVEAAQTNGMSPAELSRLMEDESFRLDANNVAYYADPIPDAQPGPVEVGNAPFPLADTFLLHSLPGSNRTIHLDFDGHHVANTAWNAPYNMAAQNHPAWDPAGDGAAFSNVEREMVQNIWQRVSEDFAPFNVDVTTQDPPAASLLRANLADQVYGVRALISPSTVAASSNCNSACGGIAYLNVFQDSFYSPSFQGYYQPAWVYPHLLGDDVKNIAEATTHEVGHNLSLNHDGLTSGASYYQGQFNDLWAPIMGVAYNQPVGQWSKGDYSNANNTGENDLLLIGASDRTPLRADDAGDSIAAAAPGLPTASAVIGDRDDQDVYSIGSCSGSVTLTAEPAPVSPNLDIQLRLLNSAGGVVGTANPVATKVDRDIATGMNATLTTSVPSGTYYVEIDGVGKGTATTSYDDYGSIGSYTLTKTGCSSANPPDAPTVTSSAPSPGAVRVAFSPGADGGSPITGFTAQCVSSNGGLTKAKSGAGSPINVTGLSDDKYYRCRVRAANAVGTGGWSAYGARVRVEPATVPQPPTVTDSVPDFDTVTVWFTPGANGGSPITGFTAQCVSSNGGVTKTKSGTSSPITVAALSNGHYYRCRVRATNAVGTSVWSAYGTRVRLL